MIKKNARYFQLEKIRSVINAGAVPIVLGSEFLKEKIS